MCLSFHWNFVVIGVGSVFFWPEFWRPLVAGFWAVWSENRSGAEIGEITIFLPVSSVSMGSVEAVCSAASGMVVGMVATLVLFRARSLASYTWGLKVLFPLSGSSLYRA